MSGRWLSPLDRVAFANSVAPDLLVSVDLAGPERALADGTEASYFASDGKVAANYLLGSFLKPALHETLNSQLPLPIIGTRPDDALILVFSQAPAVRVSPLYLADVDEAVALMTTDLDSRRQQIAAGLFLGLQNYFESVGSPAVILGARD